MVDPRDSLAALLRPRSIAVIGASAEPTKLGGRTMVNLKKGGFAGPIFAVNPRAKEIQGFPCYPSIRDVPAPVDLAIVSLPSPHVLDALGACAASGVQAVVLFSAGYAELGPEGAAEQERLAALARANGMRVLGPNCLGVVNYAAGLGATFSATDPFADLPPPGRIGFVSQSGAFGSYFAALAREQGIGLSCWITTGNECDVELADCLRLLADAPDVGVIAGYLEGCRDGPKLLAALAAARGAGKPVVLLKVGASDVGTRAVRSHTAAMAGTDAVYDAVFSQYGVYRARRVDEFLDVAYAASLGRARPGNRAAVVTISGGVGVFAADALRERGFDLPVPSPATREAMKARWPAAAVENPVDVTAQALAEPDILEMFVHRLLADGECDVLLVFFISLGRNPTVQQAVKECLRREMAAHPDLPVVLTTLATPEYRREIQALGIPLVDEPTRAVQIAAGLRFFASRRPIRHAPPPPSSGRPGAPTTYPEPRAKAWLATRGLSVAREGVAATLDEARGVARGLGYPVALKVVSADLPHKSDVGGVRLGVPDEAALGDEWRALEAAVRANAPAARVEGILVQEMVPPGLELILGARRDPTFGPVVMIGLGGVWAEVFADRSVRLAPFDRAEALDMIRGLRAWPLLDGARGFPRRDLTFLADTLVRLSEIASAEPSLLEADLNPLILWEEGHGGVIVDGLLVMSGGDQTG
jgi:acyl-CoA synthetase (NDP forming)